MRSHFIKVLWDEWRLQAGEVRDKGIQGREGYCTCKNEGGREGELVNMRVREEL